MVGVGRVMGDQRPFCVGVTLRGGVNWRRKEGRRNEERERGRRGNRRGWRAGRRGLNYTLSRRGEGKSGNWGDEREGLAAYYIISYSHRKNHSHGTWLARE